MNELRCVSVKLHLQKQAVGWTWPVGCSLMACGQDHQAPEELRDNEGLVYSQSKTMDRENISKHKLLGRPLGYQVLICTELLQIRCVLEAQHEGTATGIYCGW